MIYLYIWNIELYLRGYIWIFDPKKITFKKGWGPWQFLLLVYWWDYGLATLLGRGCQSLSRAFQLFGESHHWGRTGPILWDSVDLWRLND